MTSNPKTLILLYNIGSVDYQSRSGVLLFEEDYLSLLRTMDEPLRVVYFAQHPKAGWNIQYFCKDLLEWVILNAFSSPKLKVYCVEHAL